MNKINPIVCSLFLLAFIVSVHAQETNMAADSPIAEDVSSPAPAEETNIEWDNQEIVNDEGYGADDLEYYAGEDTPGGNAEGTDVDTNAAEEAPVAGGEAQAPVVNAAAE